MNEVIRFVDDFVGKAKLEGLDEIGFTRVFSNGYCYYFAQMLKSAFDRGTVCIKAPTGHIVWVDTDGLMYDINGTDSLDDGEVLVPVDAPDSHVADFKHVATSVRGITRSELNSLVEKYRDYDPNKEALNE